MITIFLLAFVVCLVSNLIRTGEAYIFFARFITFMNSYREAKIKPAVDLGRFLEVQYIYARRRYAVLVLKKEPLNWVAAAAKKGGAWVDKTEKIEYYAGPFKNFHGLGLTPAHISPKYEILAFRFSDSAICHVKPDQVILTTIKEFYIKHVKDTKVE